MYNDNYGTCAGHGNNLDLQSITDAVRRATESFDTVCDTNERTRTLVMGKCVNLQDVIDKVESRYSSIIAHINGYDSIVRYVQTLRTGIPALYSNFEKNPESIEGKQFIELFFILGDFDTFIQSVSENELKKIDSELARCDGNDIVVSFRSIIKPVFSEIFRDWVDRA